MMFGLTKPDETITVKPFEVFQKELVLTSSYINPYTQRRALELIDSGRLDVSSMVAKVASLDELGAILSDPALRAMGKYIIDPSTCASGPHPPLAHSALGDRHGASHLPNYLRQREAVD